ncbi:UNVERIFIED_ORG: regulation of enolase protein 1 (concanavalin A-like superfamily) [Shinella zoogloeoides]|nr:regulation of enolase protein 1 (concanavalin A-like superfamily) [Shinella zoogloeoides]
MEAFGMKLEWYSAPSSCSYKDGTLEVVTGDKTDYWRETFYDFWRDDGHFLSREVEGDFSAEVTVQGDYEALYDQAGLMMRLSESHWIKTGIEFTDGQMYFSVVVTNNQSDWSLVQVPVDTGGIRIRLTRHHEAIRVQYLNSENGTWTPVRLAYFPPTRTVQVGVMCCSPERAEFIARFKDFVIGPPIARELHD